MARLVDRSVNLRSGLRSAVFNKKHGRSPKARRYATQSQGRFETALQGVQQ
jgi:hypothetical protein